MSAADRERILQRLAKMKALAAGGVGGERENAARLLDRIAAKYRIDLDGIGSEEERDHVLADLTAGWKLDLASQLLALMRIEKYGHPPAGEGHCCLMAHRTRNPVLPGDRWKVEFYFARCTDAQFVELQAKFSVLSRDYERQRKAFYRAFLVANDLLVPFDPEIAAKATAEEMAEAEEADRLALGIRRSSLARQLPPRMPAEGGRE